MDINIECTCRLCLKNCAVSDIFVTKIFHNSKQASCSEMMNAMFSLTTMEGDGLPPKICQKCYSKLSSAYRLKLLAEHSYKRLLMYFSEYPMKDLNNEMNNEIKMESEIKNEIKMESEIKNEDAESVDSLLELGFDSAHLEADNSQIDVKSEVSSRDILHSDEKSGADSPVDFPLTGDSDYDNDDNLHLIFVEDLKVDISPEAAGSNNDGNQILSGVTARVKRLSRQSRKGKENVGKRRSAGRKCPGGMCEVCGKHVGDMRGHAITHRSDRKRFPCPDCPRLFLNSASLKKHRIGNHLGAYYFCQICNKNYKRGADHIREQHSNRPKKHVCVICSARYTTSAQLTYHMSKHTQEKAFPCSVCGKCFRTRALSNYHRRRVHEKEKKNICQYCSKGFFSPDHLTIHIRTHTKEKNYKCTVKDCGKSFSTSSALLMHKLRHDGVKNVPCSVCSKSFIDKGALNAHMISHTKEKIHPCKYCGMKFGRTDHRNRHQKTHESRVTINRSAKRL